ncbi:MAG: DUF4325 domain-containing protein [Anaerolineales bacterium]|nr:DUF4325 domain-containing protein [Anaerolineales bacterium]
MKAKLTVQDAKRWVTREILAGNSSHLSSRLAAQFGVSRVTAANALKKLVNDGWLDSSGGTRPNYHLGRNREIAETFSLPGVDEHIVWEHKFRPWFDLPLNVLGIAHHGFTEMVNNANDHSGGKFVTALMRLYEGNLVIAVLDDGIGIFEKIAQAMSLPDRRLAILELSKGKFTTDPANHSGEGIFFTSRMFDQFQIEANGLHYDHDVRDKHDWLLEIDRPATGTLVYMAIPINSQRTAREVFDEYTTGDNFGFDKTVVPVRLARIGHENLVSRSQAKRLVARFEGFRTVLLDFTGVDEIGQAFADEIFRVFANLHPEVELVEIHTTPNVEKMIIRARTAGIMAAQLQGSGDSGT